MRIALRTGGGRGVFELAGSQGGISASELFNKQLFYELTPQLLVPGRAVASRTNGKPRIKLDDQARTTHAYRLLAGVLILPKPKRELRTTHGEVLVAHETYAMTAIKVDVSLLTADSAVIRPTDLMLGNADNLHLRLDFVERMSRVAVVWERALLEGSELAALLVAHRDAVYDQDPDYKEIERLAAAVMDYVDVEGDALAKIEEMLGISPLSLTLSSMEGGEENPQIHEFGVDDAVTQKQARIENVRKWRYLAVRGSDAAKFRADVTSAYKYRCIFSGHRLPRTTATTSTGVDAAHILPWSTHGINQVVNGLCLDKLCHWALDSGVMKLVYDDVVNQYVVQVPDEIVSAAVPADFDIEYFQAMTGPVSLDRLPLDSSAWPSPDYLSQLNSIIGG